MFIFSYKKTRCINGCILFNDNSNYLYWEKKSETRDESEIVKFIKKNKKNKKKDILNVGTGNSFVASNLDYFSKIDGITISGKELLHARKLNIKNYNIFFLNKYSKDAFSQKEELNRYDLIIDANLKSFSCCIGAFENLFKEYVLMLNNNGEIITGRAGMNWSRQIRPALGFSIAKLFYKRLKEYDGPSSNILSVSECEKLARIYNLKLFYDNNICSFKKL